jgi:chromate reductase, NAD(P)H dehydrogenase (quinone)
MADADQEPMGMSPVKLVGISGSLRQLSYNTGALRAVPSLLPEATTFTVASLATLPFYSADVEQHGLPAPVERFRREVVAADALIFAVPEYNFSIPGVLKNALEWLSRPPNPPADGKPCAMFGASVSPLGTARGQFHLRHVCVSLNMLPVNTPHVDIASAKEKFDSEGRLTDQPSLDLLRRLVGELRIMTVRLRV